MGVVKTLVLVFITLIAKRFHSSFLLIETDVGLDLDLSSVIELFLPLDAWDQ